MHCHSEAVGWTWTVTGCTRAGCAKLSGACQGALSLSLSVQDSCKLGCVILKLLASRQWGQGVGAL